jgi:hypothetical protein
MPTVLEFESELQAITQLLEKEAAHKARTKQEQSLIYGNVETFARTATELLQKMIAVSFRSFAEAGLTIRAASRKEQNLPKQAKRLLQGLLHPGGTSCTALSTGSLP